MTVFRTLPPFGADQRGVSEVVRGIMDGKTNNTGRVTLATGNATTTALYDERIGYESILLFAPANTVAMGDVPPFGSFYDTTDQSVTTTTNAYPMTFNTTDLSNGVTVTNNSRLTVSTAGTYNVQFSAQLVNVDNAQHDVSIWFRKNGSNIADSNSEFTVPARKSASIPGKLIAALNFYIELNANDYVEIMWATNTTDVTIEHLSAQSSPTRPVTPSIIATLNHVAPEERIYASSQLQGYAVLQHWANNDANKIYSYVIVG